MRVRPSFGGRRAPSHPHASGLSRHEYRSEADRPRVLAARVVWRGSVCRGSSRERFGAQARTRYVRPERRAWGKRVSGRWPQLVPARPALPHAPPMHGPPTRRRQSRPYSRGRTESAPCRRKYDIAPTRALLTAPANGRRGRPTGILRGHQASNLRGRAQFGLLDEEAMPPGQSASRVAPHCHDRLTRS
jgi:hypothetical protein